MAEPSCRFCHPHCDSRNVMASGSTGQTYRNFFEFGEMQPLRVPGKFDSYGLSHTTTVPWF
ncbi:type I-F CRISPR-associated endoribonuclease Cas6/Csy4 [Vibrio sp. V33_P6A3T137]|uniref:type I-F CRISPR-associated endoribonuclease Cas6/Csy4 n=1 Tax=Vibrio sp. V33_P6A3T137 TaxID=1938685 RepID=UPI0013728DF9|nr:type I-F CRISPR-associated endoribonuclease Cas6/Csy4 [Vibrio sp. V33_P6A3T137]